ncbi:MAG: hypothetical protein ACJ8AI_12630 [Rhodopila sp.]|jgi:hypothetical protein
MKIVLLSATLVAASLMITGPVAAQNANKATESNTTGLSSADKEHSAMGGSSAGSTAKATPSMHNETTGLSSAKKQHEEANTSNK